MASAVLLGLILAAMVAERVAHYYFEWKRNRPVAEGPNAERRLALKRESDRHIEAMANSMATLTENQRRTAEALHDMGETTQSIKQDTAVLVDRKA